MIEVPAVDATMIIGAVVVVLTLAFLRFGDQVVDLLFYYRDSPVEHVEESLPK